MLEVYLIVLIIFLHQNSTQMKITFHMKAKTVTVTQIAIFSKQVVQVLVPGWPVLRTLQFEFETISIFAVKHYNQTPDCQDFMSFKSKRSQLSDGTKSFIFISGM